MLDQDVWREAFAMTFPECSKPGSSHQPRAIGADMLECGACKKMLPFQAVQRFVHKEKVSESSVVIRSNEIVMVKVKDLKPNPRNPNRHSIEQIEKLCKIIQYQGFRVPIRISAQSGFITSGHGRAMAATKLGLTEIPAMYQDYENEDQAYADLVADNAIALMSEIDMAAVNMELPNIGPIDPVVFGFKDFKVDPSEFEGKPKEKKEKSCPHCGMSY